MTCSLPHTLIPGRPLPLGPSLRDGGLNFAVFSEHAERIELCLFDSGGARELRRLPMHGPDDGVFHGFLSEAGAGLVYGYRAHGEYRPEAGLRFNANKLLLDPYARDIVGRFRHSDEHHGFELGHPQGARSFDTRNNALSALKARVTDALPSAPGLANRPRHPVDRLLIYELHAKGFSQQWAAIDPALRGRFAALAEPAAIEHFQRLGVTTLCVLPLQWSLSEAALSQRQLSNYWGYNTLGFFALDPRFFARGSTAEAQREEFRQTIYRLHQAGIEVVLDVVFNHSAEGDEFGPTLSFRGLDNPSWYRLLGDDPSRYENHSGCGNTLRIEHPQVTQFVLDCLRYWVEQMGVDGFRFDLATALGRTSHGFDPRAAFFTALRQDPLLADVHLIAEPWDGGHDGYQVGRFPGRFLDWNDKYRDAMRGYWLGRPVSRGEFARRFAGSSDLFHHGHRRPTASVNFIAVHDGFTLNDLLSYAGKHNQANGEHNRDGHHHEISHNFGVEGNSDDALIRSRRRHCQRALLASLMLSQGTPMLLAGDEFGNSQGGNNNAYCQDNPTGWLDWPSADPELIAWLAELSALRRTEPLLRHPYWFESDHPAQHQAQARLRWLSPQGTAMQVSDWHDRDQRALACQLIAADQASPHLLLLFNPTEQAVSFKLGPLIWQLLLDSSHTAKPGTLAQGSLLAAPCSVLVLRASTSHLETEP
ncbi:glycogen debranching protein GlgX [Pseudomarimonas arenosa]|uniref:Glycogen debranching protein GlgX n=1 Tax=Pseudomarimonas arenosa TaxID=2774145 RepID=A0AAW3ZQD1_9GAMM|nr:glycogen debranching protein GlgX [Pseudomarimonas arenosa]MBD8527312.1 glycogen debranching protein GlgX [Pseudomarimonas arenosa]